MTKRFTVGFLFGLALSSGVLILQRHFFEHLLAQKDEQLKNAQVEVISIPNSLRLGSNTIIEYVPITGNKYDSITLNSYSKEMFRAGYLRGIAMIDELRQGNGTWINGDGMWDRFTNANPQYIIK